MGLRTVVGDGHDLGLGMDIGLMISIGTIRGLKKINFMVSVIKELAVEGSTSAN